MQDQQQHPSRGPQRFNQRGKQVFCTAFPAVNLDDAFKGLSNNKAAKNYKAETEDFVSSNHRCCAERRLLASWVQHARRHGVPQHKIVPWVRRKLGPAVVVLRFRGDGSLGCSVPCVLCQRELTRFDLQVHCFVGDDAGSGREWFRGRLSDEGAPTPVLTAGQRRTLNLDPGPRRSKKGSRASTPSPPAGAARRGCAGAPPPPPPPPEPAAPKRSGSPPHGLKGKKHR